MLTNTWSDVLTLALTCGFCVLVFNRVLRTEPACAARGGQQLGIYEGTSPFSLVPLEALQPAVEVLGAWPAANPVRTVGRGAEVVAPFLLPWEGCLFAFYEESACGSRSSSNGRIAVAESLDAGLTWQALGAAVEAEEGGGGLGGPFVFQHEDEVFMVLSTERSVRLYRATQLPAAWEFVSTLVEAPLQSVSVLQHNGSWWLLGSRTRGGGSTRWGRDGEGSSVDVYGAPSPHGRWQLHTSAPLAAEMFPRVLQQDGRLVRLGRPCQGGRCMGVAAFEVELGQDSSVGGYRQTLVPLPVLQHSEQAGAWDAAGYSHLDVVRLPSGKFLAAATSAPPGALPLPPGALAVQAASVVLPAAAACGVLATLVYAAAGMPTVRGLLGRSHWGRVLLGTLRLRSPLVRTTSKPPVPDAPMVFVSVVAPAAGSKAGKAAAKGLLSRRAPWSPLLRWQGSWGGRLARHWRRALWFGGLAALVCSAAAARVAQHVLQPYWQPAPPAEVLGRHSKFTLMVMSYEARLQTLKHYVEHYSQCPSVGEILVVWNKGTPPVPATDLPSPVPVRVRVEPANSMNNRYKPDPDIRNRAVLSLDDDIMMPCADIERGFELWRRSPETIVGYYPRLIAEGEAGQLVYNWEDSTVAQGKYNAILTGAAFLDARTAFPAYWADEVAPARQLVDSLVNCDDLLMNFVVANASRAAAAAVAAEAAQHGQQAGWQRQTPPPVIEFVRPERRVDISYLTSGVGLSHNWDRFKAQAEQCLGEFVQLFGGNPLQTRRFDWSERSKPYCGIDVLGCLYL